MRKMTLLPAVLDHRHDLDRLCAASDRLFDRYLTHAADSRLVTDLDLFEVAQGFHLEWEVPGVRQEDLEVTVSGQHLTIRARRPQPAQDERKYHITERSYGEFQRSLSLPSEVDASGIEASLKDGVLTLYLPKQASKQPRTIPISVE
jgi:HSP20 family protein